MIYFFWDLMARSLSALPSLLLVALSWLSIQLSELITARARDESVRAMLARLDDAVFTAVREVEQVLVIPRKRASASGTLGTVERAAARASAVQAARACLGARGWLDLSATLGLSNSELEYAVEARIGAAVYELGAKPASATGKVLRAALRIGSNDAVAPGVAGFASYPCSTTKGSAPVQ
jgi:hypothetical protein